MKSLTKAKTIELVPAATQLHGRVMIEQQSTNYQQSTINTPQDVVPNHPCWRTAWLAGCGQTATPSCWLGYMGYHVRCTQRLVIANARQEQTWKWM